MVYSNAAASAAAVTPGRKTTLSRDAWPETSDTALFGSFSFFARNTQSSPVDGKANRELLTTDLPDCEIW